MKWRERERERALRRVRFHFPFRSTRFTCFCYCLRPSHVQSALLLSLSLSLSRSKLLANSWTRRSTSSRLVIIADTWAQAMRRAARVRCTRQTKDADTDTVDTEIPILRQIQSKILLKRYKYNQRYSYKYNRRYSYSQRCRYIEEDTRYKLNCIYRYFGVYRVDVFMPIRCRWGNSQVQFRWGQLG